METLTDKIELFNTVQKTDKHTKKVIYNALHSEFYGNKPIKIKKTKHRKKSKSYSTEQCRQALELKAEGKTNPQILRATGIRRGSLHWCIKRMKKEIEMLPL